jgi:hypothetical protein
MLSLPSFFTPLEREIVSAMVEAQDLFREEISLQLRICELTSREHNGYGFFTNLAIPEGSPELPYVNYRLHASAQVGGELCGFMLWIKNGRVDFLEGYPLGGDAWPKREDITDIKLN